MPSRYCLTRLSGFTPFLVVLDCTFVPLAHLTLLSAGLLFSVVCSAHWPNRANGVPHWLQKLRKTLKWTASTYAAMLCNIPFLREVGRRRVADGDSEKRARGASTGGFVAKGPIFTT
jgi:hypothetical protein